MTKKGPLDFPLHRGSESDSPTRETNLTKEVLEASRAQLEATDIRVAVFVAEFDAGLVVTRERLIQGEEQAREVWEAGGLVFTADEMFVYVQLNPNERKLFLSLKRIGGAK